MNIFMAVPAACIYTEVIISGRGQDTAVLRDHIGPDLIDIRIMRKVHHIRGVAAGGTHIDLEADKIAGISESGFIFCETEEFQMDKAAPDFEGRNGCPSVCCE